jgi:hypothetical protein
MKVSLRDFVVCPAGVANCCNTAATRHHGRLLRREREDKLDAAKEKQIRKNRKKERTIFWQGGAPQ